MSLSVLLLSVFTFVELNCENLFDCQHDTLKQDTEFLPESTRHWTFKRYRTKLNHIAQEIISCGDPTKEDSIRNPKTAKWRLPDMVALCEIENDSTIFSLCKRSLLKNAGYEYLITHSPDERGIDVALLYSPYSFKLLNSYALNVKPLPGMRPTRDILYANGILLNGDTLHVFVVHAPSRFGGEHATRPFRMQVAQRLNTAIDSLRSLQPNASIIVAGDFNDTAYDPAVVSIRNNKMEHISANVKGSHGAKGSYKYEGKWESIDQVFVSKQLANQLTDCYIHDPLFLMEEDKKYGNQMPRRNYNGMKYKKGYSDHLPLIARFELPMKQN